MQCVGLLLKWTCRSRSAMPALIRFHNISLNAVNRSLGERSTLGKLGLAPAKHRPAALTSAANCTRSDVSRSVDDPRLLRFGMTRLFQGKNPGRFARRGSRLPYLDQPIAVMDRSCTARAQCRRPGGSGQRPRAWPGLASA